MGSQNRIKIAVNNVLSICELEKDAQQELRWSGGSDVQFLKLISDALGFSYQLVEAEDKAYGFKKDDGNWTGMIGMVKRDEVDLGFCGIALNEQRHEAVQFSRVYDIQRVVFGTALPKNLPKLLAIVYPFSSQLWYSLLALLILIPILWKILLRGNISFKRIAFDVFGSFLTQAMSVKMVAYSDYILRGTWLFATTFLTFGYSAVLLSFLTFPFTEDVARNIDQLSKEVGKGNYRSYAFKGSIITNTLQESSVDSVKMIGKSMMEHEWFVKFDPESMAKVLSEGRTVIIANEPILRDNFEGEITFSEDYFFTMRMGMIPSKRFCCRKKLDKVILRIMSAGLYEKCKKDNTFLTSLKKKRVEHGGKVAPLSLEDVSGAVILLLIGYCMAFLVFLIEKIAFILCKKKFP